MSERIDHVVINVEQNLDEAAAQYARMGFTLTPRGHHSLGTSNHLAIFGDDYLELLGLEPANADKPGASWQHPPGLVGLVLKTSGADATWAALSARGVPLEGDGPRAFHRPVVVDGKTLGDARFRTLRIAADRVPNGRVFYCEHLTPELVWRPEWQSHPNGVVGLAEYVYVAPNPETASALIRQAYGDGDFSRHENGLRWQAGPVSVWYLTAQGVADHYGVPASSVPQGIERAVGLTLRVRSLAGTRSLLTANGVKGLTEANGRLVVPSSETQGVILAFVEG